jgi:hypothetical protein
MQSCGDSLPDCDAFALLMDYRDVGWSLASRSEVLSGLVPAVVGWMSDGFILYYPDIASLFSVDVEERFDTSYIETTIIGHQLDGLRECMLRSGPIPLSIAVQQTRPTAKDDFQ